MTMATEKDFKDQAVKVKELLRQVGYLRDDARRLGVHCRANILGECAYWLEDMQAQVDKTRNHWRMHFAGQALQGMMECAKVGYDNSWVVELAFEMADKMMKHIKEEK